MAEPVKIKLSTRDKNLKRQFQLSPEELLLDDLHDQSLANYDELATTISKQSDPKKKKILIDEYVRLRETRNKVLQSAEEMVEASVIPESTMVRTSTVSAPVDSPTIMNQVKSFLTNMWSK